MTAFLVYSSCVVCKGQVWSVRLRPGAWIEVQFCVQTCQMESDLGHQDRIEDAFSLILAKLPDKDICNLARVSTRMMFLVQRTWVARKRQSISSTDFFWLPGCSLVD